MRALCLWMLCIVPLFADETGDSYRRMVDRILVQINQQEGQKDATCWTTVRMMENFFAKKNLEDRASIVKIQANVAVVKKVWEKASREAGDRPRLNVADFAFFPKLDPLADMLNQAGSGELNHVQFFRDYSRITENWRIILSIVMFQLAEDKSLTLREPDEDALFRLAEISTIVTRDLLQEANLAAERARRNEIGLEEVKAAYRAVLKKHRLDAEPTGETKAGISFTREEREALLNHITRTVIRNKTDSLLKWNRIGPDDVMRLLEARIPEEITNPKVRKYMAKNVLSLAKRKWQDTPLGIEAMRSDTFFPFYIKGAQSERQDLRLLDLFWMHDHVENIFPKETLTNGDIIVRSETLSGKQLEYSFFFSDLDGMRDLALHWTLLAEFYEDEKALPLDPFAAELLTERISEYLVYLIDEGVRAYKGAPVGELFARKKEKQETFFDEKRQEQKKALFKSYDTRRFVEVTDRSPDLAREPCPIEPVDLLIKNAGAGFAIGDFNKDDLPDLFITGSGCNRLYRNKGDFRFEDVTSLLPGNLNAGPMDRFSKHALFADADNNGEMDLLIVHPLQPIKLFLQKGGTFVDASEQSGLVTDVGAFTATFFDYDNDGLLDLFIGHYQSKEQHPTLDGTNGGRNQLWHNEGNGVFKNVTDTAGLGSTNWTMASVAFDFDQDGLTDLFVANDFGHDQLYHNRGNGRFDEVGAYLGANDRGSGMNASVVDIDRDGDLDIYVTMIDMFSKNVSFKHPGHKDHLTVDERILNSSYYISGNKLLVYEQERFLPHEQVYFEPGEKGWGWGACFFDYDNDGDDDFYLSNGFIGFAAEQRNIFMVREHDYYFMLPHSDENAPMQTRAVAAIDLNNSGRIDLVVKDFNQGIRVLKNNVQNEFHWLKVRLQGVQSNGAGIGATVRVFNKNQTTQTKVVTCGSTYLSQEDTTLIFGLGTASTVDKVEVTWPGGRTQTVKGPIKAGQLLRIKEANDKS